MPQPAVRARRHQRHAPTDDHAERPRVAERDDGPRLQAFGDEEDRRAGKHIPMVRPERAFDDHREKYRGIRDAHDCVDVVSGLDTAARALHALVLRGHPCLDQHRNEDDREENQRDQHLSCRPQACRQSPA